MLREAGPSRQEPSYAKDIALADELTVHLAEARPGLGGLDYRVFLSEMARLEDDVPLLVEHLSSDEEYRAAVAHVRGVAGPSGSRRRSGDAGQVGLRHRVEEGPPRRVARQLVDRRVAETTDLEADRAGDVRGEDDVREVVEGGVGAAVPAR